MFIDDAIKFLQSRIYYYVTLFTFMFICLHREITEGREIYTTIPLILILIASVVETFRIVKVFLTGLTKDKDTTSSN